MENQIPKNAEKLPTRAECSKILESRGYSRADYPGVWISPDGDPIAWFQAICKEKLKFDRKDKPWVNHVTSLTR